MLQIDILVDREVSTYKFNLDCPHAFIFQFRFYVD